MLKRITAVLTAAVVLAAAQAAGAVDPVHGIAMHGEPKYPADFRHFEYVNPGAPKGGEVRLHAIGSFDSLNPFIVKGQPPVGAALPFETLTTGSADEAFTQYGLIAESIEVPEDRSWVAFTLRPEARWHDGRPITVEDVIFSLRILKEKGQPFYRLYFSAVEKAEKAGERKVRFTFKEGENRELPLIIGQMPILPRHYWENRQFDQTTLEAPLGSGPYRVAAFEPGRFVVYERVKDHWAADLPVSRGLYNYDSIRYDYYRDTSVALEAFKAGGYDFRPENESKKWATGCGFPAVQQGLVKKEEIDNERPTGMQAFAFNTRRPLFRDARVRQALAYAFDFEWTNRSLFYGQYQRTESYFSNSELAAEGPPTPAELALLEPLRGQIPEEVLTGVYQPPKSDGSGNIRPNLRKAMALLKEAGWQVRDGRLVHSETGRPFAFEVLLVSPAFERITLPFTKNLERLGIQASVRTVDTAQYKNRVDSFDFDMIVDVWGQSLSPGNEQREFWGSESAHQPGSRNTLGIENPAVDRLVELVIAAPDRESLIDRTRALDRVLLWNHYVIPHWHIGYDRVAYWDKFGRPEVVPMQGYQFFAWWIDPAKPLAERATRTGGLLPALIGPAQAQEQDGGEILPAAQNPGESLWTWVAIVAGITALFVFIMRRRMRDRE